MDYRERDKKLKEVLSVHPCTIWLLVEIGIFPGYEVARRRLKKLRERKWTRIVGTVQFDEGRPLDVYFCGMIKPDWLYHETRLSQFLLKKAERCVRGSDVDQQILPDATALIDGRRLHVELDTGEVPYSRVLERFAVYAEQPDDVLWITSTESRMEGLRQRAGVIADKGMFTTYERCLNEWTTYQGEGIRVG